MDRSSASSRSGVRFSTLLVFPNRLALFQESIQTFLGIFRFHELTEVKLLNAPDTSIHACIEAAVDRALCQFQYRTAQRREFADEFVRLFTKALGRSDFVDEADRLGLSGFDDIARQEQFQRPVAPNEVWKEDRGHRGKDSYLDFRLAESGPVRGENHIAGNGKLAATAQGHSIDQRQAGDGKGIEKTEHAVKLLNHFPYLVGRMVFDGDPSRKSFSLVVDDEHFQIPRGVDSCKRTMQLPDHGDVYDVQRWLIQSTLSRISQTMLEYSAGMKEVLLILVVLCPTSESHIIPKIAFTVFGALRAGYSE